MNRTLLAIAAASLALASCTTSGPTGVVNRFRGGEGQRDVVKVRNNAMLDTALQLANPVHSRPNDVLVVQVELVNTRQSPLAFQWTVEWFDQQGLLVDYATQNWTPERLAAGASKTIKLVAPSPAATSWQLQTGSRDEVQ
jgi:uncharacterized protein YcfL